MAEASENLEHFGGAVEHLLSADKSAKLNTYAIRATITVVTIIVVQSVILWSVKVTLGKT